MGEWTSQVGQDQWVMEVFRGKRNGYFVDIGAHDGITYSNSFELEKSFDWTGICAEPNSKFSRLKKCRSAICVDMAVAGESNKEVKFFEDTDDKGLMSGMEHCHLARDQHAGSLTTVRTISLRDLLKNNGAPKRIDYLSVDTEGSEWEIMSNFDFSYTFGCMTIEHNGHEPHRKDLRALFRKNGYLLMFDMGFEDWFIHQSVPYSSPFPSPAIFTPCTMQFAHSGLYLFNDNGKAMQSKNASVCTFVACKDKSGYFMITADGEDKCLSIPKGEHGAHAVWETIDESAQHQQWKAEPNSGRHHLVNRCGGCLTVVGSVGTKHEAPVQLWIRFPQTRDAQLVEIVPADAKLAASLKSLVLPSPNDVLGQDQSWIQVEPKEVVDLRQHVRELQQEVLDLQAKLLKIQPDEGVSVPETPVQ